MKENTNLDKEVYTTGSFAALGKTTPRTLRFYDQKGLLKPSALSDKGYRLYTKSDLDKLQKILLYKTLGFSLEEIGYLLLEGQNDLLRSLKLQSQLVKERIDHLRRIDETLLSSIKKLEEGQEQTDLVHSLLELIALDDQMVEQYKNARNLKARIKLHSTYSTNPVSWFDWLFQQLDLPSKSRILEVGCGNGELWKGKLEKLSSIQLTLSDLSEGMVLEAKNHLEGEGRRFLTCNAQNLPFHDESFDRIIANHTLFYLSDLQAGLAQIGRVLKKEGIFYASTYGKHHMQEILELVKQFDDSIILSQQPLYESFGLENGQEILEKYFKKVHLETRIDSLEVTNAEDLANYILSCHGNQNEKIVHCYPRFLTFLENHLKENGTIHVTKEAGLFVCYQPKK